MKEDIKLKHEMEQEKILMLQAKKALLKNFEDVDIN